MRRNHRTTPAAGLHGRRPASLARRLLDLRPRAFVRAMMRQSASFWWLCLYLMIEYVRPQQVWEAIDFLPWGQFALGMCLVTLLFENRTAVPRAPIGRDLVVFSVVFALSIVVGFDPGGGLAEAYVFVNWLLLFYLTTRIVTNEVRFLIFFLTFLLWSLKMSQFGTRALVGRGFGFLDWGATGGPGWFHNSGEFAIQMCVFLPMAAHFVLANRHLWSRWKTLFLAAVLPGTALLALLSSSSRGGQLGGAVVLLFMIAQSRHRVRGFALVAVILPLLWFITPAEQKTRFQEMGEDETSQSRITYWKDGIEIIKDHPVLGLGYEGWLPYYRRYYNPSGQLPHNIFIEAGAELGLLGLGAFLLLIVGTFRVNRRTRKMAAAIPEWGPFLRSTALGLDAALVGYLVSGFFVTVLFYPYFWMNLAFTASLYQVTARRYGQIAERQRLARRDAVPRRGAAARPAAAPVARVRTNPASGLRAT